MKYFFVYIIFAMAATVTGERFRTHCKAPPEPCVAGEVLADVGAQSCWTCVAPLSQCRCVLDTATESRSHTDNSSFCVSQPLLYLQGVCVTCPQSRYVEESRCTEACSQGKYLLDRRFCVDQCPARYSVGVRSEDHRQQCVPDNQQSTALTCPQHEYHYQGSCVTSCPVGWNYCADRCVQTCSLELPYLLVSNNTCVTSCPVDSYSIGRNCFLCDKSCDQHYGCSGPRVTQCNRCIYAEKQCDGWGCDNYITHCINSCPPQKPYAAIDMKLPTVKGPRYTYICSSCDGNEELSIFHYKVRLSDQLYCMSQRPDNLTFMVDGVYTDHCPQNYTFREKLKDNLTGCYLKCRQNRYHEPDSSVCSPNCSDEHPFRYDQTCLSHCPVGVTFLKNNFTCVDKCSTEDTWCVPNCPKEHPRYVNGSCIHVCPVSSHFTVPDDPTCYSACPDNGVHLKNDTRCLKSCPAAMPLIIDQIKACTDMCPTSHKYLLNGVCFSRCVKGYGVCIGSVCSCVDDCPNEYPMIFEGKCVVKCPNSSPFVKVAHRQCMNTCPGNTAHLINDTRCLSECPQELPWKSDGLCLASCPRSEKYQYIYNHSCVETCPEDIPNVALLNGTYRCVEKCPELYPFVSNNNCLRRCPDSKPMNNQDEYADNPVCVEQCPESNPYYYRQDKNSNHGKCITGCPEYAQYVVNNECKENCPYTFCEVHCSNGGSAIKNGTSFSCVDRCSGHLKYTWAGWCLQSCPWFHCPDGSFQTQSYGGQTWISYECDNCMFTGEIAWLILCTVIPVLCFPGICVICRLCRISKHRNYTTQQVEVILDSWS